MDTNHTPPTQAELDEWKRLHSKRADSVEDRRLFDNHAVAYFTDLIREVERLTKEVRELRKDKERLDWLDRHSWLDNLKVVTQAGSNPRTAIDAAMQQKGEE